MSFLNWPIEQVLPSRRPQAQGRRVAIIDPSIQFSDGDSQTHLWLMDWILEDGEPLGDYLARLHIDYN
jgi:hypothetical protein